MAISTFESEINELKEDVLGMMNLVSSQVESLKNAFETFDQNQAEEIISKDKKVNSYDLVIDKKCERILALHTPVAVDLRFIISSIKINSYLERIGDNTKAIAKFISLSDIQFDKDVCESLQVNVMFEAVQDMLNDAVTAYEKEDIKYARLIYKKDKILNEINFDALERVIPFLNSTDPLKSKSALQVLSSIRKMERMGDLIKNLVEETIFYLDAKVLKHKSKKQDKLKNT